MVKNGNIYWGKNEDVIFTVSLLLEEENGLVEETLSVISFSTSSPKTPSPISRIAFSLLLTVHKFYSIPQ